MVPLLQHLLTDLDAVKVIHGANDDLFMVAGATVESVRSSVKSAFNIPYFALPFVNGEAVGVQHVLAAGDVLEFVGIVGFKGGGQSPPHEATAQALLDRSPELQAIAAEIRRSALDRHAAIDRAILLVTQHFLTRFGPLDDEAHATAKALAGLLAAPLASVAADVRRIADRLDPPPSDIVDTVYVAEKLGLTVKRISQMALAGEIPAHCIVPGTGHGTYWKFFRSKIEPWIEARPRKRRLTRN